MSRDDALEALKALQTDSDPEAEHWEADLVLCQLLISVGYKDVVEEYNKVTKWYA